MNRGSYSNSHTFIGKDEHVTNPPEENKEYQESQITFDLQNDSISVIPNAHNHSFLDYEDEDRLVLNDLQPWSYITSSLSTVKCTSSPVRIVYQEEHGTYKVIE